MLTVAVSTAGIMKSLCVVLALVSAVLPNSMVEGACKTTPQVNASGTIDYPSEAPKGEKCTFNIKVKDMSPGFVTLKMSNILLSKGGKLEIYDGEVTEKTALLDTITGLSDPLKIEITFSNNVHLVYTVGDDKPQSRWDISYVSDECEQNMTNAWVEKIESPKHLPTKDKSFQCTYRVTSQLPFDRIPVVSMQLGLTDKSDLELTNGQSTMKYTDKTPPEDFFGTDVGNPIEAVFKVTDASTKPTFSLVVDPVIQECSGSYDLNETVSIDFTVPADHPAQYNCRYLVVARPDTDRILAEVSSLSLVAGSDIIRFMDTRSSSTSGQLLTSLSTNPSPGYLVATTSNSLIITVNVGNAEGERSVKLTLSPQENGGRFTGSGKLTAGNSKEDAVETISAYFQLTATTGNVVSTQLLTKLPDNATLSFYDGLQTSDKLITVFNSKTADIETVIGGPEMLLVLDSFPATENFTATFDSIEPGCDQLLTDVSGQLTFSNEASFNGTQNCTLTIYPYSAVGDTLVLNFDSLTIGDGESVLIYSGDTVVAEFNAKNSQASEVYLSGGPTAARILIMNGGAEKTRTSLTGRYSVKSDVCGGNLPEKSAGQIVTPNFPNQYPLNAQCTWFVSATGNDPITPSGAFYLNFKSINLAAGHSIKVADMNNGSAEQLASYMGSDLPDDFIVPVATGLNVKFSSSAADAGMKNQVAGGAQISYMVLSCGGKMSEEGGTFSSPGFPKVPSESAKCVWIVEVPAVDTTKKDGTNIVSVTVTLKDTSAKTLPTSLMFYDGPSVRSSILTITNITKGVSEPVLSRYRQLVIKYDYQLDSKTKDKAGFNLTFNTYYCNSSQLCDNGVCLHPNWRCNGVDDCGDNTDERGCVPTPAPITPTPKPSGSSGTSGYVKGGYVALLFFIALILGAVLVLIVPKIIRKLRGGGGSYSRMHDNAPVVT